ncbi:hypothetical protein D1007_20733 [Hordeum vulgare]|nr:hypothetical protein D1007_20733 [Hordeum vulgare]
MANFELDPERYVPPGHHIIDGGPNRLPRTFITPAIPIARRHEQFIIAEVMPAPPANQVGQVRQDVVDLLQNRGFHVRSAQPWIAGVGLFELRDAGESFVVVQMVPQDPGDDSFIRFMRHNEGAGFRGAAGFRQGCLMFLGVPLGFRNTDDLRAAVNTFGEFHHWVSDDPYLVCSIIFASFPDDFLVPRSVTFSEYATWGGARVSWSTPLFILGAAFAEQMPNDEDHMPLNGNPHPMPGQLELDNLLFALPPYPALGWNDVPPPPPMLEPLVQPDDGGWGWQPEVPEAEPAAPEQDQASVVIDQPTSSDSVQEIVVVDPQQDDVEATADAPGNVATADHAPPNEDNASEEEDAAEEAPEEFNPPAIVPYRQPIFRPANLMIGAVRVAYGPPLLPVVSWTRSFEALMGVFNSLHVPRHLQMPAAMPILLPKRSWSFAFDADHGEPSIVYKDCTPAPSFEMSRAPLSLQVCPRRNTGELIVVPALKTYPAPYADK